MIIKFERTILDVDQLVSDWKSGWKASIMINDSLYDIRMIYIKWGSITIYMIEMMNHHINPKTFWGTLSQCEDWFTNTLGRHIEIELSDYDTVLNNLHSAAKEKKRKESEALSDV